VVAGEVDDSDCPLTQHILLSARMVLVFSAASSKVLESALHDGLTCPRTMLRGMSARFRLHSTARDVVKASSRDRQTNLFWYRSYARVIPRSGSDRF